MDLIALLSMLLSPFSWISGRGCRRRCRTARSTSRGTDLKAAISNSCPVVAYRLLTINRSPATLTKAGSHYDQAVIEPAIGADAPVT